jgi:ParB/RepB/Spo0J family partition protein
MNIQKVPVDKICPNTWNPNKVEDKVQSQLIEDIKRDGFTQPIIVRVHPKKSEMYEIIDGEHRWNAVKELDWKEVDCLIEEKNDAEAMIRTITMNKLRGEFDSIKLAEVLVELKKTYSEEELVKLLGFSEEELKSYEELLDFDPESLSALEDKEENAVVDNGNPETTMLNTKEFSLDLTQLDVVETAIEAVNEFTPESALAKICKEYLQNNFPDKFTEVEERAERLKHIQDNPGLINEPVNPPMVAESG